MHNKSFGEVKVGDIVELTIHVPVRITHLEQSKKASGMLAFAGEVIDHNKHTTGDCGRLVPVVTFDSRDDWDEARRLS